MKPRKQQPKPDCQDLFRIELDRIINESHPTINTRLMVSFHYLKYAYNLSGMIYFEHKHPIHPSSMSWWRTRIGEQGAEQILKQTINSAFKLKLATPSNSAALT